MGGNACTISFWKNHPTAAIATTKKTRIIHAINGDFFSTFGLRWRRTKSPPCGIGGGSAAIGGAPGSPSISPAGAGSAAAAGSSPGIGISSSIGGRGGGGGSGSGSAAGGGGGAGAGAGAGSAAPSGIACQVLPQFRHFTFRPVGPMASSFTLNLESQLGQVRIIGSVPRDSFAGIGARCIISHCEKPHTHETSLCRFPRFAQLYQRYSRCFIQGGFPVLPSGSAHVIVRAILAAARIREAGEKPEDIRFF